MRWQMAIALHVIVIHTKLPSYVNRETMKILDKHAPLSRRLSRLDPLAVWPGACRWLSDNKGTKCYTNDTVDGLSVVFRRTQYAVDKLAFSRAFTVARDAVDKSPSDATQRFTDTTDNAMATMPPLGGWLKMCSIELNELSSVTKSRASTTVTGFSKFFLNKLRDRHPPVNRVAVESWADRPTPCVYYTPSRRTDAGHTDSYNCCQGEKSTTVGISSQIFKTDYQFRFFDSPSTFLLLQWLRIWRTCRSLIAISRRRSRRHKSRHAASARQKLHVKLPADIEPLREVIEPLVLKPHRVKKLLSHAACLS